MLCYILPTVQVEEAVSGLSLQDSKLEKGGVAECAGMEETPHESKGENEEAIGQSTVDIAPWGKAVVGEVVVPIGIEVCSPPGQRPPQPEPCKEHTVTAQPVLPPYSAVAPSQNTPVPTDQSVTRVSSPYEMPVPSPPPYFLLPPEYPQLPGGMVSPPDPTDQVHVKTGNRLIEFQCAVCKHKSNYQMPSGQRIRLVRCPRCKECTVWCIYAIGFLIFLYPPAASYASTRGKGLRPLLFLQLSVGVFSFFKDTHVSKRNMVCTYHSNGFIL